MENNKVEVIPYNVYWPDIFEQEGQKIQNELNHYLKAIHHIGSTSIPNMSAKPVIDMLLEIESVDDIDLISKKLSQLGYDQLRRQIIPHRSFFTRRLDENISFHLHIYERGDPQVKRHVNFKEYLMQHVKDAEKYAALKIKLAKQFQNDIYQYVLGKDKLVQEIDVKAKLWSLKRKDFLSLNCGVIAKNWTKEKIIKAMEANLNIHMTYFAQYLNEVELIRVPGYTLVNSSLRDDTFNYVLDANFNVEEANKKIAEISQYFANKQLPFSWWVCPNDKPDDLIKHIEQAGYKNSENNRTMYFDLDAWNPEESARSELEIVRAMDEKTLQDFALVLTNDAAAFKKYFSWIAQVLTEDDPIEYYVGYIKGKPVVRGLSCYYAGVAGLHWLSTVPEERKKGYGAAMQQFRLNRAKELGFHIAVLQASTEGYSLYKKLGYKEFCIVREFKLSSTGI